MSVGVRRHARTRPQFDGGQRCEKQGVGERVAKQCLRVGLPFDVPAGEIVGSTGADVVDDDHFTGRGASVEHHGPFGVTPEDGRGLKEKFAGVGGDVIHLFEH